MITRQPRVLAADIGQGQVILSPAENTHRPALWNFAITTPGWTSTGLYIHRGPALGRFLADLIDRPGEQISPPSFPAHVHHWAEAHADEISLLADEYLTTP